MLGNRVGRDLLELVGAGLVIAILERSGLDDWKRAHRLDCAAGHHALVLSRSDDVFPDRLAILAGKGRKALVAIRIDTLADIAPRCL